ncbi:hypothetical protein C7974DRAFT_228085 [Boeremia exigua]|uniref:uncharacterized protein n=1 Tax=Boeremia exigua TaxID=749465 RepID=UPI001E8E4DA3|nr:uncharacterized protein C7974DRAFT_228085 [Boeremia exigua]KAH6620210.1 hypothetical protein C7974DRAFT_228085 [Boeremia exigua]
MRLARCFLPTTSFQFPHPISNPSPGRDVQILYHQMSEIKIPSSYGVPLGTLYNGQSDEFLSLHVLESVRAGTVVSQQLKVPAIEVQRLKDESLASKFAFMRSPPPLGASVLGGMVTMNTWRQQLLSSYDVSNPPRQALRITTTTVQENLDFNNQDVRYCFSQNADKLKRATHVCAKITWGIECVVIASAKVPGEPAYNDLIDRCFRRLEATATSANAGFDDNESRTYDEHIIFTVDGDIPGLTSSQPTAFRDVFRLFAILKKYDEMEHPLTYTLLPTMVLEYVLAMPVECSLTLIQPSVETIDHILSAFDDFRKAKALLAQHEHYVRSHRAYVAKEHISEISDLKDLSRAAFESFQPVYARVLYEVRSGQTPMHDLTALVAGIREGEHDLEHILRLTKKFDQLLQFVTKAVSLGAKYYGYKKPLFDIATLRQYADAYVFEFDERSSRGCESWPGMTSLLLRILDESQGQVRVALLDCDGLQRPLSEPCISHYRHGILVEGNVWKKQELLAKFPVISYNRSKLRAAKDGTRAVHRRPVKIPCGSSACDPRVFWSWLCSQCQSTVDFSDHRVFSCACGQWDFRDSTFKCPRVTHGTAFVKYADNDKMYGHLQNLAPYEEVNILILGESGVGKSTFINSLVNYLHYPQLEDALEGPSLTHIIPFSFATQLPDENDPRGRIVQKTIRWGSDKNENDGSKGRSATQQTQVHTVTLGPMILRLIDTPGIGDTRGAEQDKKNMADILSVLRGYTHVHGILILLKPNNSRLTVMFRYFVKELLTHLHRSAANNMVFGFTNTRGSNYQPGDTFKPLQELLKEFDSTRIELCKDTVYCFDSESFRYLAAHKQGVTIGDRPDYERSWNRSTEEARRLLAHFKSLQPHQVKSTMSLNETRIVITQLTKPMAQIAQKIKASIATNEDDLRDLQSRKMDREGLRKKLEVSKQTLRAERVEQPRTVCSNSACTESETSGIGEGLDGSEQLRTVYKTICHDPCHLENVQEDKVADPGLIQCYCIIQDGESGVRKSQVGKCRFCHHSWQEHLHIRYELKPSTVMVVDTFVQRELEQNANLIQVRERGIESKKRIIKEFQQEYDAIKRAAGRFTLFLRKNSITPYNDATVEYLDFLIKEEKPKVQMGASRRRLHELERYRSEHVEIVEILSHKIEDGKENVLDEAGVDRLVHKLYRMEHYGPEIRRIREVIDDAGTASFREQPHRIMGFNVNSWIGALAPKVIETGSRNLLQKRQSSAQQSPPVVASSYSRQLPKQPVASTWETQLPVISPRQLQSIPQNSYVQFPQQQQVVHEPIQTPHLGRSESRKSVSSGTLSKMKFWK